MSFFCVPGAPGSATRPSAAPTGSAADAAPSAATVAAPPQPPASGTPSSEPPEPPTTSSPSSSSSSSRTPSRTRYSTPSRTPPEPATPSEPATPRTPSNVAPQPSSAGELRASRTSSGAHPARPERPGSPPRTGPGSGDVQQQPHDVRAARQGAAEALLQHVQHRHLRRVHGQATPRPLLHLPQGGRGEREERDSEVPV